MSDDDYNYHYNRSKRLYKQNRYNECLVELKKAFQINPSENLQIKINKLEDLVNVNSQEIKFQNDENKILINNKYYVDPYWYNKLYKYQRKGVEWLFSLFEKRKGGILGDDMGLGKTIQTIFFLRELFESKLINKVLIIMPKSLLINWEREFREWGPNLKVLTYFGTDKERNLRKTNSRGGILITTYNTIVHSWADINQNGQNRFDVIILDEGHKIKNPSSKTCKSINALRSDFRLILTGTAMQNNLKELWTLFDFIHQGALLGTYQTFRLEYEKPIIDSRKKDATANIKALGIQIALSLKKLVSPFMLRRTKEQITNNISEEDLDKNFPKLPKKTDFVVWIYLRKVQQSCYEKFLQLDEVKALLTRSEKRSPLVELTILKKICDHPRLLPVNYCHEMGMSLANNIDEVDMEDLLKESGKTSVCWELLKYLLIEEENKNHKCLVFSQSKVVLNIIQKILRSKNFPNLRLDGDVKTAEERQSIVDKFNEKNGRAKVLLLTSQVGGVGLTLTGADRVIICDLSWNPAVDAQAVDRVYRIGQRRDVVVYRLVTCGTLEEKIYRRQIFKDGLGRQATGVSKEDDDPCRHFTESDLRELFKLEDPTKSETQKQLSEFEQSVINAIGNLEISDDPNINKKKEKINYNDELIKEKDWLISQKRLIFDIGHHDLLFTEKDRTNKDLDFESQKAIEAKAMEAEQRLKRDAEARDDADEFELRKTMASLSVNETKTTQSKNWKSKFNPPISSNFDSNSSKLNMKTIPELFKPNKNDIKRTQLNIPKSSLTSQKNDENIQESDDDNVDVDDDDYTSNSGEENEKSMIIINDSSDEIDDKENIIKNKPFKKFLRDSESTINIDSSESDAEMNLNDVYTKKLIDSPLPKLNRLKIDDSEDEDDEKRSEYSEPSFDPGSDSQIKELEDENHSEELENEISNKSKRNQLDTSTQQYSEAQKFTNLQNEDSGSNDSETSANNLETMNNEVESKHRTVSNETQLKGRSKSYFVPKDLNSSMKITKERSKSYSKSEYSNDRKSGSEIMPDNATVNSNSSEKNLNETSILAESFSESESDENLVDESVLDESLLDESILEESF